MNDFTFGRVKQTMTRDRGDEELFSRVEVLFLSNRGFGLARSWLALQCSRPERDLPSGVREAAELRAATELSRAGPQKKRVPTRTVGAGFEDRTRSSTPES
eukprot:scaffold362185_cov33-Prasinocladus_malaysianus.AAC.1